MTWFEKLLASAKNWFIQSSLVHLRQDPASSTTELVALIDRFLDGNPRYGLEWDDFISWKSDNPHVEAIRDRIGEHEKLLFSLDPSDELIYSNILILERNKLAVMLGLPTRECLTKL
jgi:hypothetical protein